MIFFISFFSFSIDYFGIFSEFFSESISKFLSEYFRDSYLLISM